jgi:hypothetical protein
MNDSFEAMKKWVNADSRDFQKPKTEKRSTSQKGHNTSRHIFIISVFAVILILITVIILITIKSELDVSSLRSSINESTKRSEEIFNETKKQNDSVNSRLDGIDSEMDSLKEEQSKLAKKQNQIDSALHTVDPSSGLTNTSLVVVTKSNNQKIYNNIALSADLQKYAYATCKRYNVNYRVFIGLMSCENRYYNPNLISRTNDYGLCQINKCNHKRLSKILGITNFLDSKQNILAGVFMLNEAYNAAPNHNSNLALMVYNMGYGGAKNSWNNGIYSTHYSRSILQKSETLL